MWRTTKVSLQSAAWGLVDLCWLLVLDRAVPLSEKLHPSLVVWSLLLLNKPSTVCRAGGSGGL